MAESRLQNLGTVFTRIKGLIRGGAMKYDDRPLWYDIYEAFPPKLPPVANRPAVMKEIEEIMYPEDIIRAQFYKRFNSPGVINLVSPTGQTLSQRFVVSFLELAKDSSIPRDELFQAAVNQLASQGTVYPTGTNENFTTRQTVRKAAAENPDNEFPNRHSSPSSPNETTTSRSDFGQS